MFDYLFHTYVYKESYIIEHAKDSEYFFGLLFEKYYDRIYKYGKYHYLTHAEAEDICSQVFMTLVDKIKDFEYTNDKSFESWLFRIAFYHISNMKRYSHSYIEEHIVSELMDIHTPKDIFSINDMYTTIMSHIEQLPIQQKTVCLMKFEEELSNKEIAQKLSIPEKHVSSILTKAKSKIRNNVQK